MEINAQISGGDIVTSDERLLLVHNFIDTNVCVEVGLNILKDNNRTISSSATVVENFSIRIFNVTINL